MGVGEAIKYFREWRAIQCLTLVWLADDIVEAIDPGSRSHWSVRQANDRIQCPALVHARK